MKKEYQVGLSLKKNKISINFMQSLSKLLIYFEFKIIIKILVSPSRLTFFLTRGIILFV